MLVLGLGVGSTLVGSWLQGQNPQPIQPVAVMPRELTSYRDVVKRVLPVVVSIETRAKQKLVSRTNNPQQFDDPNVPEDLRRFFEVDRYYIAQAAVAALAAEGKMSAKDVARAIKTWKIDTEKANPLNV